MQWNFEILKPPNDAEFYDESNDDMHDKPMTDLFSPTLF